MADDQNFLRYLNGASQGYNPYGTGNKVYGGGRPSPNLGPTSSPEGYIERDARGKQKRNAMLRRMKAGQSGNFMNPDWLRGQR